MCLEPLQPQLGRLIGLPIAAIGVLAAVLTWELEHVGAVTLGFLIAGGGVLACLMVVRRVRARIDYLSDYYGTLLKTADEQSQRADAANRLKDDFLSTLSHELRTPLNSVLGWARLLAGGKLDDTQSTKAIQAIERAGLAQSRLIEDLLDISRIVTGRLEITTRHTRVPPLIDAAVRALAPAAEAKRITVETALDAEMGAISADPERLQQVVWNLLSNAIKFTPSGGRVRLGLTSDGRQIRLTVGDSGIGFNPEVAAHMFERFRQGDSSTTRQYGGLGLGLGIVRSIVELHGGTVTAESAGESHGSVFTVCLPILSPADILPATRSAPPAPALTGVSVLVVDDDPQQLEFIRAALEEMRRIRDARFVGAGSARPVRAAPARRAPQRRADARRRRSRSHSPHPVARQSARRPHTGGGADGTRTRRRSAAGARGRLPDARRQTDRSVRSRARRRASRARRMTRSA